MAPQKTSNCLSKWYLPKSEGGASLPFIWLYHLSCLLHIGLDWIVQVSKFINFGMESAMAQPYELSSLLHSNLKLLPPNLQYSLLIQDTVITWRDIRKRLGVSLHILSCLPIYGNPMFPQATHHKAFYIWRLKGLNQVASLYDTANGWLKPYQTIASDYDLPDQHVFHIMQLSNFIIKICPKPYLRTEYKNEKWYLRSPNLPQT